MLSLSSQPSTSCTNGDGTGWVKREDLFENLGVPENWGNPKPLVFLLLCTPIIMHAIVHKMLFFVIMTC
jgi:hypothetical protein